MSTDSQENTTFEARKRQPKFNFVTLIVVDGLLDVTRGCDWLPLRMGRKRGWLCWLFLRRNEILQKSLGSVSNKFGLKVVSTEWAMIIHRFVVSVQFLFVFCME